MSFPRYERYKDSGVEWLGEVPEHWTVAPVRSIVQHLDKRNEGAECQNYLSLMANIGVMPYAEKGDIGNKKPEDLSKCKVVRTGNIVINSMNYNIGSYGMSRYDGVCSPVYVVLEINEAVILPRFGFRIFQNTAFQRYAASFGNGILAHRAAIGWDELKIIGITVPPKEEQQTILTFLDDETLKIDALIEEQQRLIDLLKEKRQAVILHAVSSLHFSEAIGSDAPVEQSQDRLRNHIVRIEQGWSPLAADRDPEPGEWAVLKLSAVKRGEFDGTKLKALPPEAEIAYGLELKAGDLLVTRANTPDLVGDSCYVYNPPPRLIFSDLIYRLVLNENTMSGEFLNLVLQSAIGRGQAKRDARGSSQSMVKLGHDHILNWLVPVPPLSQQHEIVRHVRARLAELNRASEVCSTSISLLNERRTALVSAAVTGKIDVRVYMAKPVMSATQYSSGFAHQLLAAEILDRCNSQRMGRIKLQKLIHLCEYHGQVSEVQGDYSRKAAGPFDARAMAGISKNLKKQKWFEEVKEGERYVYRPLEKRGEHKKYLAHWQDEMPRIDEVLGLLGNFRTRECEIVSTLYAAWNDLLIDGASADDAAILHEASSAERWHKSKEQIAPERWTKALQWMKEKGLVPGGYGKHTRHAAGQIGTTTEEAHEPA